MKEKQEKGKVKQEIISILNENLNLKHEVHKLRDQNNKLLYKTVFCNQNSRNNSECNLKHINQEFRNLNKDSSV